MWPDAFAFRGSDFFAMCAPRLSRIESEVFGKQWILHSHQRRMATFVLHFIDKLIRPMSETVEQRRSRIAQERHQKFLKELSRPPKSDMQLFMEVMGWPLLAILALVAGVFAWFS